MIAYALFYHLTDTTLPLDSHSSSPSRAATLMWYADGTM
jgi:hypothetical protein